MTCYFESFLIALQFFTIIPVNKNIDLTEGNLKRSILYYPIIGLLFGIFISIIYYSLYFFTPFSSLTIAAVLVTVSIFLTGGLHLDGWIDCSDAYFSYRDKEKRLEIMKDPRVGAFGVLSLLFLLGWRFLFIYEITASYRWELLIIIPFIPMLSRIGMGMMFMRGKLAKNEGLAHYFQRALKPKDIVWYSVYILPLFVFPFYENNNLFLFLILLYNGALLFEKISHFFINKQFGGITGDTLGAAVEGCESWLWMILWLLHYFGTG
ncbi:adenosylcobinamide-GDP ribazoletransferase [Bacillus taeanensis]|uniref:Adenosylcobinamide-GDP ribazoletransferase n=1 Tax=Bacillus taeanensis TaxID=273032 RepID=A0A366XXM7_9BACI|nr:adenosylcobinamide-GDP ribazoletransferase [Bacillus taeanensis]